MTGDRVLDRARAFIAEGPTRAPGYILDVALERTASVRQDPAKGLRFGPVTLRAVPALAGALAIAVAAAFIAFVAVRPGTLIGPGSGASDRPSHSAAPSPRPTDGGIGIGIGDPGRSFRPYEGTSAEWMANVAACLRDKGWDATIGWDGGMQVNNPGGTATLAALQRDKYACWDVYGGPRPFDPPTDAEIRAIYNYWAHDLRDCLMALGYTISEPPSEQEFVDTYPRTEGIVASGPWSPYNDLPDAASGSREVNQACPQVPPN